MKSCRRCSKVCRRRRWSVISGPRYGGGKSQPERRPQNSVNAPSPHRRPAPPQIGKMRKRAWIWPPSCSLQLQTNRVGIGGQARTERAPRDLKAPSEFALLDFTSAVRGIVFGASKQLPTAFFCSGLAQRQSSRASVRKDSTPSYCRRLLRCGISNGRMSARGQTRTFGDVGSMSGLPESGNAWAIYGCTPRTKHRPQGWLREKSAAICGPGTRPLRCVLFLACRGRRHVRGRPPLSRFRTIQVCPKDLASALRQSELAVNRPTAARRAWRTTDVRHEAARVYFARRRRGRLAVRGAGTAARQGLAHRRARDDVDGIECCEFRGVSPKLAGAWIHRGAKPHYRVSLRRRPW